MKGDKSIIEVKATESRPIEARSQSDRIAETETPRSRYIVMTIILAGVFMVVLDGSVVNIALPTITSYFNVNIFQSQWIVTSYLAAVTSLLLIFGKVAERLGKARIFMAGFCLFTLSSLGCGISSSLPMLIGFRVLQGIGAAMAFSISTALIFHIFPIGERGRAMGYIGSTVAAGSIAGPILGGFIVSTLGWQYIFLINVPIGIAMFSLALKYLKVKEVTKEKLDLDWSGALATVASLVSLIMLISALESGPWELATGLALAFILSLSMLMLIESRIIKSGHRTPLLDISIFKAAGFTLSNTSMVLFFMASFTVVILSPFYMELVLGYKPKEIGAIFLIVPAIMAFGSPLAGWLYDRYFCKYYAASGMLILAGALALMGWAAREKDSLWLTVSFVPLGVGSVLFQIPNNADIMSSLPPAMMATSSSIMATFRNLGMALGASLGGLAVSLQLSLAGYYGPILHARPELLSTSISNGFILACLISILGAWVSLIKSRYRSRPSESNIP